jgi:outer membrane protein TolC
MFTLFLSVTVNANEPNDKGSGQALTLNKAIYLSQKHDIWLVKSNAIERGLNDRSIATSTLPDPILSSSILNLPSDGFDFNQEPMTQMKFGIAQLFPRGDTLKLQKQRHLELASEQPLLRAERKAKTVLTVTRLWLSAFQAQASTALVEKNKVLFEQLKDIASTSYSSLVGKGRQQDIINAEVELLRLNERLLQLTGRRDENLSQLGQWLINDQQQNLSLMRDVALPNKLPPIDDLQAIMMPILETGNISQLTKLISDHPLVKAKDKQIEASQSFVQISKQQYKPQWGVNASYAYRDDDQLGRSRADFLSVGISVKIPIFSHKAQDAEVSYATRLSEAKRTEKKLLLRELVAGLSTAYANYKNLLARSEIYENKIIPQLSQQSKTVLTAYTSDDGSFAEVTQNRIAELDAKLALLDINIQLRKNIALLQYYISHKLYEEELTNE